ncbi:Neuropeptide-like peptide 36 [Caenorhabditis elegans]|uniref:Neuropeptide-like peptide 36 n=1 Tax=Caenorhabditis elegans TaxID=6239 RepID=NLP36_CAEEL|nr:Neuropeptide-like peptide 36 [Caenorhabditis elegans]Q03561.1 RecName: Full=Neuropeptide-like peptide 36; Flags: Precursor [Caenorhabditis elegans]CAA79537.1 Neuropeptide-like peptide 36 [Caenorhabditis elegans]|eukprot:NP_499088.1 Neuropeptide-like peptide 36 [Caenorhabditis elegans]
MSVDLKQQLELADYLGALAVWCIFFGVLFILSVIFNFVCIKKDDDVTALERWGYKKNIDMKLGPHRRSMVARQIPQTVVADH